MSTQYEVAIQKTGVVIMTTNDKHRAMAATIFRAIVFGPLEMREVVRPYRRRVWTAGATAREARQALAVTS